MVSPWKWLLAKVSVPLWALLGVAFLGGWWMYVPSKTKDKVRRLVDDAITGD